MLDGFEQQESERTVISYNIAMKAFEKAAFFVERRIPQNDTNLWAISTSIKQYQPVSNGRFIMVYPTLTNPGIFFR